MLLPILSNKLLAQWQGLFLIVKGVGKQNYQVDIGSQKKRYRVCRVNMPQPWQEESDGVEKAIRESEQCESDLVIGVELSPQQSRAAGTPSYLTRMC